MSRAAASCARVPLPPPLQVCSTAAMHLHDSCPAPSRCLGAPLNGSPPPAHPPRYLTASRDSYWLVMASTNTRSSASASSTIRRFTMPWRGGAAGRTRGTNVHQIEMGALAGPASTGAAAAAAAVLTRSTTVLLPGAPDWRRQQQQHAAQAASKGNRPLTWAPTLGRRVARSQNSAPTPPAIIGLQSMPHQHQQSLSNPSKPLTWASTMGRRYSSRTLLRRPARMRRRSMTASRSSATCGGQVVVARLKRHQLTRAGLQRSACAMHEAQEPGAWGLPQPSWQQRSNAGHPAGRAALGRTTQLPTMCT